jgi:hypothetical protein
MVAVYAAAFAFTIGPPA